MNELHHIKKLNVRIDGRMDAEKMQSIREICREVIEKYFDLHGPADKTFIINKIHLDLGAIRTSHFTEEFTVRLSYLLRTELQSFIAQPGMETLMEQKVAESKADILTTYLKKGYGPTDGQALNELFEHFLQTNVVYLKGIIDGIRHSPAARKRLFYQVKFTLLEAYWSETFVNVYREIAKVNSAILQDVGEAFTPEYNEQGIQGVLKKWTFAFMMGQVPGEKAMLAYLELLKTHIDDFKPHEKVLKKSAFHYLEELTTRLGIRSGRPKKEQPPRQTDSLLQLLLDERRAGAGSQPGMQVHDLGPERLKALAEELVEQGTLLPEELDQLQMKLLPRQFEELLRALMRSAPARLSGKVSAVFYVRKTVGETFGEELFRLDTSFVAMSLAGLSVDHQVSELQKVVAIIAAKKDLQAADVTERLLRKLEKSAHTEAQTLKTLLKQVQAEEAQEPPVTSSTVPRDLMGAYLHYLKSGVWLKADITPEKALEQLLKENPEHLIMQLNAHMGVQVVWLRLVYQQPVALLLQLFQLVFEEDPGLDLLLDNLKKAASSVALQRKILGAFISTRELLSKKQGTRFEALLKALMVAGPSTFAKGSPDLAYLAKIVRAAFSEELSHLGLSSAGALLTGSAGARQLKALLEKYLVILAAKKGLMLIEVTERLLQHLKATDNKEAKALKKLLTEIRAEEEKRATPVSDTIPKDLSGAWLHFLKFGVWIREESTPAAGLEQLLDEHPLHLVSQLNTLFGVPEVWLRLVYQHPVPLVLRLFQLLFEDDPDLSLLLHHLESVVSSPQRQEAERKVLEAFVIARMLRSEEQETEFKALFETYISELTGGVVLDAPADQEVAAGHFHTLLAQFLVAEVFPENMVPPSQESMLEAITQQPHVVLRFLRNETIPTDRWKELLSPLDTSQLLEFIRITGRYAISSPWTGHLLMALGGKDAEAIFGRESLIRILQLLAQAREADLKSLISQSWQDLQKTDPELIKKLQSGTEFKDFSAIADTPDLSGFFEKAPLPPQEVAAFEKELETWRVSLKELDMAIPDLETVIYDIVPLAKSLAEVKAQLLHRLSEEYPGHEENLRAVIDAQDQVTTEKSLTALMKAFIDAETVTPAPWFETFEAFEERLAELLRHTDYVFDLLSGADPDRLVVFLERLSPETIQLLAGKVSAKFSTSDYARIHDAVLTLNAPKKPKITLAFTAWGLAHQWLDVDQLLEFLMHQVPGLHIPEITAALEAPDTHLPAQYVEGFIHFILHQRHIFLPVELDGMTTAFEKIITRWPHHLISYLRKTPDLKMVAGYLLDLVLENEQESIFVRLFPAYRSKPGEVLSALEKAGIGKARKAEVLAAWMELALHHNFTLSAGLIIPILRAILKPGEEAGEPAPLSIADPDEVRVGALPPAFLQQGIASEAHEQFTVLDLITTVIRSGTFPSWSATTSLSAFAALLDRVSKAVPALLRQLLQRELTNEAHVRHLFSLLGHQKFTDLLDQMDLATAKIVSKYIQMAAPDPAGAETGPKESPLSQEAEIQELPQGLLHQGIATSYADRFNVFDLIRTVIQEGRFPHWSVIRTRADFSKMLLEIATVAPALTWSILFANLKTTMSARNLLAALSTEAFAKVLQLVHKSSWQDITTTVRKLVKAHAELGQKQALADYFYVQYTPVIFSEYREQDDQAIFRILSHVPVDFGMSSADYRSLLEQSTEPVILRYLGQLAKRPGEELVSSETRTIDLLFHLILKNAIPWWASENEVPESTDETIGKLISETLDKDPKLLLTAISKQASPSPRLIYERILPHVAGQQFDKILVVLSPNFGGFIISFNLLLNQWKKMNDKVAWHSFLLGYLVSGSTFYPVEFISAALARAAKLYRVSPEKLSSELLAIAKKLIQEGEMRFLPFMELLKPVPVPEAPPSVTNVQEPVFVPADLIASVVHYLKTGSLPVDGPPQMTSYMAFAGLIERQLQFGHQELRLSIIKTLADRQVQTRVVRHEREHFLLLLVSVLYPSQKQALALYKQKVQQIFRDKWPSISTFALQDLFYQSIFEHVMEPHFHDLTAADLIQLFFQKAEGVFRQSLELTRAEMERYGFGRDLVDKLITPEKKPPRKPVPKAPAPSPAPETPPDALLDQRVLIKNAGLVIVWPFFSRYFDLLGMISDGKFKSEDDAVRGVLLLQYIATGSTGAPEHELLLNKVLCGVEIATPVPLGITLTAKEVETTEMMLRGLLQNWGRVKNTSIEALREGFLMRDGYLIEKENTWELKVEKKTVDILMEQIPWTFGTIKISWMEKRLNVEWL